MPCTWARSSLSISWALVVVVVVWCCCCSLLAKTSTWWPKVSNTCVTSATSSSSCCFFFLLLHLSHTKVVNPLGTRQQCVCTHTQHLSHSTISSPSSKLTPQGQATIQDSSPQSSDSELEGWCAFPPIAPTPRATTTPTHSYYSPQIPTPHFIARVARPCIPAPIDPSSLS